MRKLICLLAVFVLLATSTMASMSKVTNVALDHRNGQTIARVDVDGIVRFSHQTEVAKDGKPFRVILDILKATHNLGAKNFMSLPECAVKSIRTSQYAVKPEAVVRVVFDMNGETTYRVNSDQRSVSIYFPDKARPQFAAWSSKAELTAASLMEKNPAAASSGVMKGKTAVASVVPSKSKSPAEINKAINKDRMASLSSDEGLYVAKKTEPKKTRPQKVEPEKAEKKPVSSSTKTSKSIKKVTASVSEKPKVKDTPFSSTRYDAGLGLYYDKDKWADLYKDEDLPVSQKVSTSGGKALSKVDKVRTPKKSQSATAKTALASKKSTDKQVTKDEKPAKVSKPAAGPVPKSEKTKMASMPVAKSEKPALAAKSTAKPKADTKPSNKTTVTKKTAPPVKDNNKTAVASVDRPKNSSKGKVKPPVRKENTVKTATKTSKKSDSKTVANVDKPGKTSDKKSTARFRRNPAISKKIKGTMVAEFPKRLVVKYKTGNYRDPFATLINETKVSSSPTERKIPNVDGLKLVGIIQSDGGKNSALLEDGNGYGYILKSGDRVRNGYVLRIESDRIYFQIFEYGWSRTMALNIEE